MSRIARLRSVTAALLLAPALAGCGASDVESHVEKLSQNLTLGDARLSFAPDRVAVEVGTRRAEITAAGALTVDGTAVPVGAALQPALAEYVRAANALRETSVQTGLAGAKVGREAVGAVIDGLLKGESEQIGARVEAKAGAVVAAAALMCERLAEMQVAQDAIVAGTEAFRPFASLDAAQVADCRRDLAKARAETEAAAAQVAGSSTASADGTAPPASSTASADGAAPPDSAPATP